MRVGEVPTERQFSIEVSETELRLIEAALATYDGAATNPEHDQVFLMGKMIRNALNPEGTV